MNRLNPFYALNSHLCRRGRNAQPFAPDPDPMGRMALKRAIPYPVEPFRLLRSQHPIPGLFIIGFFFFLAPSHQNPLLPS